MPKDEEDPKKPDDQVVCYRELCVKFINNNKKMTNLCVLILVFLLLILLPAWAVAGMVEGSVQGLTMVVKGKFVEDEKVFVILTAGKEYYFLPNVNSVFLERYINCRVRATGNMHPNHPAIETNKIELFRKGEWETVWTPSMQEKIIKKDDLQTLVLGNSAFSFDLFQKLKNEEVNLCFSPNSISSALAMVYAGARGGTKVEMAEVLHFYLPRRDRLGSELRKLQTHLITRSSIKISIANYSWEQKGDYFFNSTINFFELSSGSGFNYVDFEQEPETARNKINSWGMENSQQKIKELIKPSMINSLTSSVFYNTIYFKGDWLNKFNKANTKMNAAYHISHDKTIKVPMMSQRSKFKIKDFGSFSAIELPYKNASMIIFLPKRVDDLADFEKKITKDSVISWIYELSESDESEVLINLPKVKTTFAFELSKVLSDMGMSDAFRLNVGCYCFKNFNTDICLSNVIHQSFLDIDEEGTAAASATAAMMTKSAVQSPLTLKKYPTFKADHPFVFLIREHQTGSILFIGRVVDPTK